LTGPHTDAQVLVFHDVVGLYGEFKPRFVKRYLEAELPPHVPTS
jgi:3-methyl-2-oxobutanoate hydroxymethyltransferase